MSPSKNDKIAFFLPGLYGGGAERVFINLADGFVKRHYQVDFVLAQLEGSFADQIPQGVRLVPLRKKNRQSFRTISSFPALIRYLQNENPYAMISGLHGNLIAILAKKLTNSKTKLIVTEHNTLSIQNQLLPKGVDKLNLGLIRWFYPRADEIVAVSQGVADDLKNTTHIDAAKIKVIYNPIVTTDLLKKMLEPVEHPWFESGNIPVIIAVGRLTEQKDFSTLISAFRLVSEKREAKLLILGEGEDREKLTSLISSLNLGEHVLLPGFVGNPYKYLAHSDLFVLSSKWEGLPTVLVEAMACGIPVVSTDCPSGPREILKNGRYGKLVPVGDVAAMAKAILEGMDHQLFTPPERSWQDFTVEKTVDQYIEAIFDHT